MSVLLYGRGHYTAVLTQPSAVLEGHRGAWDFCLLGLQSWKTALVVSLPLKVVSSLLFNRVRAKLSARVRDHIPWARASSPEWIVTTSGGHWPDSVFQAHRVVAVHALWLRGCQEHA